MGHAVAMAREIPEVVRAAAGLAATVLDEARKLPETLPGLPGAHHRPGDAAGDEGAAAVRRAGRPRRRAVHRAARRGRARAWPPSTTTTTSRVPQRLPRVRVRPCRGQLRVDDTVADAEVDGPAARPRRRRRHVGRRRARRRRWRPAQQSIERRSRGGAGHRGDPRRDRDRRAGRPGPDAGRDAPPATGTPTPDGRRRDHRRRAHRPSGDVATVEAAVTDEGVAAAGGARPPPKPTAPRPPAPRTQAGQPRRRRDRNAPTRRHAAATAPPLRPPPRSTATTTSRSPSCGAGCAATRSAPWRSWSPTSRPPGPASRTCAMLRNRLEKLEEQAVESSPLAPRGACPGHRTGRRTRHGRLGA